MRKLLSYDEGEYIKSYLEETGRSRIRSHAPWCLGTYRLRDRTREKIHVKGSGFGSLALSMTGAVIFDITWTCNTVTPDKVVYRKRG